MSRSSILILFGVLVIVAPFSGLPSSFRAFLLVVFGAAIVIVGLMERLEHVRFARTKTTTPVSEDVLEETPVTVEPVSETPVTEPPHGVSPI